MPGKKYELEGEGYGPSSKQQIAENNKRRAKPVVQFTYDIDGPIRKEMMTRAANQKNAEIDRDNAFMEKRLARRKNRAKEKFNDRSDNGMSL